MHHTHKYLAHAPTVVNYGQADELQTNRQHVLDEAYTAHPKRFVNGRPGAEATLTAGPSASDNGEHLAVVEEMPGPAGKKK